MISVFKKHAVVLLACAALGGVGGCTVMPVELGKAEREQIGVDARARLFADQERPSASVTLAEATARAVKYYADYRLRTLEEALAGTQLDVARFDMLPRLTASAGYTTRNNDSFGFGFSPGGTIATNPSASSERSHNTLNLGFTWNVLDFGVSYFRAKTLADQVLIARERRHKAVQLLVHDVRQAWYRAEAAQRLLPAIDVLLNDVEAALERTRLIEVRKLLPPTQIISLRRALLELEQQISFRRQELAQSRAELAALINLAPGTPYSLESSPPESRRLLEIIADPQRLETTALNLRPELAEEGYRARASESEAKKALLGVLPNLTLDFGLNYDSNRFLVNNSWTSAGLNIAYNLVKVFSIPAMRRNAAAQEEVDQARRLAMAMAIMTQTRISMIRYSLVSHEYGVWEEAARDDEQIVKLLQASQEVGIDSELELIRARARAMSSAINRDLSHANLQSTVAQIYQSVGYDVVTDPKEEQLQVTDLTRTVGARLEGFEKEVFSEPKPPAVIAMAMGPVAGVEPGPGALLAEGMNQVFAISNVRLTDPQEANFRIVLRATLQPPKSGSQAARLDIRVLDGASGDERYATEFKTTLSDPVDDEQLRVLGEGAAYRILIWAAGNRTGRPGTNLPPSLRLTDGPRPGNGKLPVSLDGGSLNLQMDAELNAARRMSLSQLQPAPPRNAAQPAGDEVMP